MNTRKPVFFKVIVISICVFINNAISFTQVFSEGEPLFNPESDTITVPDINISLTDEQKSSLKKTADLYKNDLFAVPVDVSISPETHGVWVNFPSKNMKIWLASITVEQARTLSLILDPFRLKNSAKLFFYNESKTEVLGAITAENNRSYNILPLSLIDGTRVFCELQISDNDEYGFFTISKIGVELEEDVALKSTNDRWFDRSDTCHVNVNCYQSDYVQTYKDATCRIVFGGTSRCTGTLINNLIHDRTPYVLTAGHCFNTEYMANTAVYYFNYESPTCENEDGELYSVSGSTLLASGFHVAGVYDSLDFTLVRLSEDIPSDYSVHYAGWDASGRVPDSTYVFHHPEGDVKKISINRDPLTYSVVSSGFEPNTHWNILNYEVGSTEDGSSGSGLIDEYGRLIGSLSGGNAVCSVYMNDFFQMFKYSYNYYEDTTYQLQHWLDPYNYGNLTCDSYNSHVELLFTSDRLCNFQTADSVALVKKTEGWGYISGHNSDNTTEYAEKFIINGSKYLLGALIDPAIIYGDSSIQQVKFILWDGEDEPDDILYEQTFLTEDIMRANDEIVDSLFWIDFDSSLIVSNSFYYGYQIGYTGDTFALNIYEAEEEDNTAYVNQNGFWGPLQKEGDDFPAHLAIKLLYSDFMPEKGYVVEEEDLDNIFIYPNPVGDQLQVFIKYEFEGNVSCLIYDLSGRAVYEKIYESPGRNIPLPIDLERGVYILRVSVNNTIAGTFKILVE